VGIEYILTWINTRSSQISQMSRDILLSRKCWMEMAFTRRQSRALILLAVCAILFMTTANTIWSLPIDKSRLLNELYTLTEEITHQINFPTDSAKTKATHRWRILKKTTITWMRSGRKFRLGTGYRSGNKFGPRLEWLMCNMHCKGLIRNVKSIQYLIVEGA